MIIAGEASGDLHGSRLVASMRSRCPDCSFFGMGGPELKKQGVDILFDPAKIAVVGVVEVITHLADIFSAQKILRRKMAAERPELLIIIDFPDFNLLLAKKAKRLGIPVFYYITPQVWAWRKGRVKTMKKVVDRLGVILPFEKPFFQKHGLDVDYVGHPLLDSVEVKLTREQFVQKYSIKSENKVVGLLPGSRKKEIISLLPIFLQAAKQLQSMTEKNITFVIPLASTLKKSDLDQNGLSEYTDTLDIQVLEQDRYELMASSDCVIAASGTVALELALVNTPFVVVYKVSPLTWFLGKLLVKIDFASLVNLIAEKEVVSELLQYDAVPERISEETFQLLFDEKTRQRLMEGLDLVRKRLGEKGASDQAAAVALECIHDSVGG